MQEINETDFLNELLYCISEADVIKAQALLQFFPQVSAPFQSRILYEISIVPTDLAGRLLSFIASLEIHEEMVREKLYEVILDKAYQDSGLIAALINEGRSENRRIVVKVVGDMRFRPACPELIRILKTSTDVMLLKDCIKVLSKIGDDTCVPVIADFIFYDDPELKTMAVFAMGELRSAASLEALRKVSKTKKVDRMVLNTIAAYIDAIETHLATEKKVAVRPPARPAAAQTPAAQPQPTQAPATQAPPTQAPATQAPPTQAPATQAPATQAPATQAPATQAPATQAPATQAPATPAPATQAPTPEPPSAQADEPVSPHDISGETLIEEDALTTSERLSRMLVSNDFEKRHAAMEQLASLGTEHIDELAEYLEGQDADLQVNTLKILDHIGGEAVVNIIRKYLYRETDNPLLRFAVYDTIEHFPSLTSAIKIIEGIDAPDEVVRMASAAAMNKHLSDLHVAGLKTRVESGGATPRRIIGAILDSKSHKIFDALSTSDAFIQYAAEHLNRESHPEVKNFYMERLKSSGKTALARTIGDKPAEVKRKNRKVVFVVHYSRVILDYLEKILYKAGYHPVTFRSPEKAVSRLSSIRPDLLITAVFLNGIDGITFSDHFRMLFQNGEVPETLFLSTNELTGVKVPDKGVFIQLPATGQDLVQAVEKAAAGKKVSLGAPLSYARVNELLTSEWLCLRSAAINLMANLGADTAPLLRMNFQSEDGHLIMSSLKVAEKIWDTSLTPEITALAGSPDNSPGVRIHAFEALSLLETERADFELSELLDEEIYPVRLAAIRLMDRWMDDPSALLLKDLVETPGPKSHRIVSDIIDSFAVNAFNRLMRTDSFAHLAMYHLARNVHETTRDFYLDLLRSQGLKSLARSIQQDAVSREELDEYPLFIITGSRIRQSIITTLLNGLGAPLIPFESWDEAMEMFEISTPLGIVTDLTLDSTTCLSYLKRITREQGPDRIFVSVISDLEAFKGAPRLRDPHRIIENTCNSYGIDRVFYLPVDLPELKKTVQEKIREKTQLPD